MKVCLYIPTETPVFIVEKLNNEYARVQDIENNFIGKTRVVKIDNLVEMEEVDETNYN